MKKSLINILSVMALAASNVYAQTDEERIRALEEQVEALTSAYEDSNSDDTGKLDRFHLGGYGELHYNNLEVNDVDEIQLNFRRFVLYFGYDFNDRARFVSELEVENTFVSASSRGAVELEQAYLEFDLQDNMQLRTGIMLMPLGIISETHEPDTFYGVNRPIIELTIIPTTWFSGGVMLHHRFNNGISYDLFLSEGLKTDDPGVSPANDPFYIKGGKQKTSFADAHDLAITGRIKYTGLSGLELAAYGQYQPDLDQSAITSYADSATLLGGHVIYQLSDFEFRGLYARWDLDGDAAKTAGKDVQDGGYLEVSYRPIEKLGFFVRQSAWSQEQGIDEEETLVGVNYWPYEHIVFKFDIQSQNDDAQSRAANGSNSNNEANRGDGFNIGMGYSF